MILPGDRAVLLDSALIAGLAAGVAASIILMYASWKAPQRDAGGTAGLAAEVMDFQALQPLPDSTGSTAPGKAGSRNLFVGELRVVAIGSAYPIPYDAATCPFSGIPQPEMNQLDRDGDGITDDWELKYGLDRYKTADAAEDPDGDGFSNLEEFRAFSDPGQPASHPPYAGKLRFVQRKDRPFPLVFQGFMEQSDGNVIFQLNNPATGKSHFLAVGEGAEGVVVKRFEKDENGRNHRLFVSRGAFETELIRGETALDPESKAELINILDRSSIMVTMGALLSLHNDEYIVLGVYSDKVVLKNTATGEVYDIVGLTDGKR